jgi:hypothetical protein
MRRMLPIVAALLLAGNAFGQNTAVTLQNQESSWFYFVLDPAELAGLTPSSPLLAAKLTTYFSRETEDFPFTALKPRTGITLEGLPEGSHLLIGFFVIEEEREFPVRVISLLVDRRLGQRLYEIYSDPALLTLARGVGKLARFGGVPQVAAASQPPAAQTPPAATAQAQKPPAAQPAPKTVSPAAPAGGVTLASFGSSFSPVVFTRETEGDFSVHPMAESLFWNRDGTRIVSVSASRADSSLTLDIASASGFSRDVSYYFYLFSARRLGQENSFTVEVKPVVAGQTAGLAILWEKGRQRPLPIGTVNVQGNTCRVTARLADLPPEAVSGLGGDPSADLTACYFDSGSATYEEFFYTTLTLAELPSSTR